MIAISTALVVRAVRSDRFRLSHALLIRSIRPGTHLVRLPLLLFGAEDVDYPYRPHVRSNTGRHHGTELGKFLNTQDSVHLRAEILRLVRLKWSSPAALDWRISQAGRTNSPVSSILPRKFLEFFPLAHGPDGIDSIFCSSLSVNPFSFL